MNSNQDVLANKWSERSYHSKRKQLYHKFNCKECNLVSPCFSASISIAKNDYFTLVLMKELSRYISWNNCQKQSHSQSQECHISFYHIVEQAREISQKSSLNALCNSASVGLEQKAVAFSKFLLCASPIWNMILDVINMCDWDKVKYVETTMTFAEIPLRFSIIIMVGHHFSTNIGCQAVYLLSSKSIETL